MKTFYIDRTRLVKEYFRISADTEEDAFDAMDSGESEYVEKLVESTLQCDAEIVKTEEE